MQYFVSIENKPYFQWQIELLIESFKLHGLQDQLCIGIVENQNPCSPDYRKNLQSHQNIFSHKKVEGPVAANKLWGISYALENKLIQKPFTVIHPDMVLQNPVQPFEETIVFSKNQEDRATLKVALDPFLKKIIAKLGMLIWIPLGDVLVFNETTPDDFFQQVLMNLYRLDKQFNNPQWKMETAAWILTMYDNFSQLIIRSEHLEQTLMHHRVMNNFIHYKHGNPPKFSKYYYKYELPITFIPNDFGPYQAILNNNVTSSTDYVCKVIDSYLNSPVFV